MGGFVFMFRAGRHVPLAAHFPRTSTPKAPHQFWKRYVRMSSGDRTYDRAVEVLFGCRSPRIYPAEFYQNLVKKQCHQLVGHHEFIHKRFFTLMEISWLVGL